MCFFCCFKFFSFGNLDALLSTDKRLSIKFLLLNQICFARRASSNTHEKIGKVLESTLSFLIELAERVEFVTGQQVLNFQKILTRNK